MFPKQVDNISVKDTLYIKKVQVFYVYAESLLQAPMGVKVLA